MKPLRLASVIATGSLTASMLVSSASCMSAEPTEPPLDSATLDPSSPSSTTEAAAPDAADLDASASSSDARTDARPDTGPLPLGDCDSVPVALCNFDRSSDTTCPLNSALGFGYGGSFSFVPDGGLDGSTAFRADAPDAGAVAVFGMSYRNFPPDGQLRSYAACHLTCEANLRVAQGTTAAASIVAQAPWSSLLVGIQDGGWVHAVDGGAPESFGLAVSTDWVHVTFLFTPADGGTKTTEVVLSAGDASTPPARLDPILGSLEFGAVSEAGAVSVYVDDVICRTF